MRHKNGNKQSLLWGSLVVLIIVSGFMLWGLESRHQDRDSPVQNVSTHVERETSIETKSTNLAMGRQAFERKPDPMMMLASTKMTSKGKLDEAPPKIKAGFAVRPPYPKHGEKFSKPIAPKFLADPAGTFAPRFAKPGQIIPWNHARKYIGQTITVEGKVVLANRRKTVCFLNFTKNWKGRFYVILFKKTLGSWPDSPDRYFLNKTVHVTGKVVDRKGTPQIQVTRSNQIVLVR